MDNEKTIVDNEATMILNPVQNASENKEQVAAPKPQAKKSNTKARVAATVAGAAVGAGAAVAADHAYAAYVAGQEENVTEENAPQDTANDDAAAQQPEATPVVEEPVNNDEHVAATAYEPATPVGSDEPAGGDDDDEVHVVGVSVGDNGEGGMATAAVLQSGDDMALIVDVDTDGTIDILVHDDNENGTIESDEIHDISENGLQTAQVIEAYVDEAHSAGQEALVTNVDTGQTISLDNEIQNTSDPAGDMGMDDNMYMTANDDMPDYMNDADAGLYDA